MEELLREYEGKRIAVWCMRYTYRGVVKRVNDEVLVLGDAYAVEVSGKATQKTATTEDKIPSDVIINLNAIEIFCQPTWV